MPLTKFPHGVSSFGVPATGSQYLGMWGTNVWFVDGVNGSDGASGKDPQRAFYTIAKAVNEASAEDVIYIRGQGKGTDASDPLFYDENVVIPYAKYGLAIVGTNPNQVNPFYIQWRSGGAGSNLTVNAPNTTIENICFNHSGGSTTGIIRLNSTATASQWAGGALIANCHIRNATSAANAGIVSTDGGHYYTVIGCTFVGNHTGINFTSGTEFPLRGIQIIDCNFVSVNSVVVGGRHVTATGVNHDFFMTRCSFDQKGGAAVGGFVFVQGAGIISDCYFGSADITASAAGTAIAVGATVFVSGCHDNSGTEIAT